MIYLITAPCGSFKTLSTLMFVEKFRQDELKQGRERNVYYFGINELTLDSWFEFDTPSEWYELPDNSIIVIDECQKDVAGFGAKSHLKQQDRTITDLETHRHRGFDIFLITQGPHLINSRIKPLTNVHRHLVRRHGWGRAKLYEHDGIITNPENRNNLKGIPFKWFKPDKKFYSYYKSATMHTVRRKIPRVFFAGIAVFIFLVYSLYSAYDMLNSKVTETNELEPQLIEDKTKPLDNVSSSLSKNRPSFNYSQETSFNPIVEYMPRVKGMPETAPAYDELRRPVTLPRPSCIMSDDKCICYTQQATVMSGYPKSVCRSYVRNGRFDPTVPDAKFYSSNQDIQDKTLKPYD